MNFQRILTLCECPLFYQLHDETLKTVKRVQLKSTSDDFFCFSFLRILLTQRNLVSSRPT